MRKSHKKLLQLSAQNNRHAFKELYDQTSPTVYSLTLHFLQRKYLAEEVLQEIYVEIWQCCASYNPEKSSAISWMLAITRNRVIDKLCAIKKRGLEYPC